jgi:hypothetical protein
MFGLSNPDLVSKLLASQDILNSYLNNPNIAPGQPASYYTAFQTQLESDLHALLAAPTFILTAPTSGTYAAGQSVSIQWTAGNVPAGSLISLCYDKDTTLWNDNEKWIEIDKVAATNGNGSYSWGTTGVAAGTYYIGGYLYSGGIAYNSHLTQSITIAYPPVGEWSGSYHYDVDPGREFQIQYIDITLDPSRQAYSGSGTLDLGVYQLNPTKYLGTIYNDGVSLSGGQYNSADGSFTAQMTESALGSTWKMSATISNSNSLMKDGEFIGTTGMTVFSHFTMTKTSNLTLQPPEGMVSSQLPSGTVDTLTQNALAPIVAEAIARWRAAGLPAQDVSRLAGLNVQVADLPGPCLGVASADGVLIDKDAAGYGWFIDQTPNDDSEFTQLSNHRLAALPQNAAQEHVDLLTTVMHEMGHVLGYDHDAGDDLMSATLPLGVRWPSAADRVFAEYGA